MTRSTGRKHVRVSCALIERDGFVLATQRGAAMTMALKWEFPGGTIKPEETPEECLHRELVEELDIRVFVTEKMEAVTHDYPSFTVILFPFVCAIDDGDIVLKEHHDARWLPAEELSSLDWAEADLPILEAYRALRAR